RSQPLRCEQAGQESRDESVPDPRHDSTRRYRRVKTEKTRSVYRRSAYPTGHRSDSYESSRSSLASRRMTNATFQPRFHASWIPVFIPCAPTGLCMAEPRRIANDDGACSGRGNDGLELTERQRTRRRRIARDAVSGSRIRRSHADDPPGRRRSQWEKHRDAAGARERVDGVGFERAVGFDVTEHEVLRIASALERESCTFSDGTVCTVAAEQVRGIEVLVASVGMPEDTRNAPVMLLERNELDAAFDCHARPRQIFP